MPLLPNQEDEQNPGGATGGSQTVPQTGGGTSGVAGSSSAGGSGSQTAKGTGFVNVDRYTKANAGQNFGGQVKSTLDTQGQGVQSSLSGLDSGFRQAVDQGSTARNAGVLKNISSGNAAQVVGNKDQLQSYQDMRNASYNGPREFSQQEGYTDFLKKYNQTQQNLQNTSSDEGRYALLNDLYNRPTYNRGERRLDQAILQTDPNARAGFADLRDKYSGLQGQLDSTTLNAQNLVTQRAADMAALQKEALVTAQQADKSLRSGLATGLKTANTGRKAEYDRAYQDRLNEILAGRTTDGAQRDKIKSDLSDVLQYGGNLSLAQYANPDQIAQYNALAQLLGTGEELRADKAGKAVNKKGEYKPKVYESKGTLTTRDGKTNGGPVTQADKLDKTGRKADQILTGGKVQKQKDKINKTMGW
jgi:hypothetical protein